MKMKAAKKYLIEFFLLLIALLICGIFVFRRIFKERLPHEINYGWNIYSFLGSLTLFLLFFYILLKKLKLLPESENEKIIWVKENLLGNFVLLYDKALKQIFKVLIEIKVFEKILLKCCKLIIKIIYINHTLNMNYIYLYYIIYAFPKCIVMIALFIDVIFFNKYYYVYKFIWVLLIPFFWKILYFLVEEFYILFWKEINLF